MVLAPTRHTALTPAGCCCLQVPRPVPPPPPPPSPVAPEVPTVCNAGEDLVIFTASANGPLQCDAAAGSGVGANTGTVVVSDFSALSRRGLGWVQAGMVCFDLGCDQTGAADGGGGEWPDGDADNSVGNNFAPTPAPVAVNANMAASQGATAASSSSSNLSFASKKPTIRKNPNTRRASPGRTLAATWRSAAGTPPANWLPVPYSFAATSTAASVPIQASVVSNQLSVAAAPAAPQQQCRFAVCKPRGQQQPWSNAGH